MKNALSTVSQSLPSQPLSPTNHGAPTHLAERRLARHLPQFISIGRHAIATALVFRLPHSQPALMSQQHYIGPESAESAESDSYSESDSEDLGEDYSDDHSGEDYD